jgi:hypothetical protein
MPYLKVPFDPPPSQFVVLLPRDSLPCCFVVYWLVVGTSLLPLLLQGGAWRSEFSSNHQRSYFILFYFFMFSSFVFFSLSSFVLDLCFFESCHMVV